jgi:hypothetical protein
MKSWLGLVILLLCSMANPAIAQQGRSFKNNPELVSSCFQVHGKVFYSNGTPSLRIWRIGSSRILGVLPPENEIVPSNLARALRGWDREVFADLEVCPFTKDTPGAMQMVCVESATHMVVRTLATR